MALDPYQRLNWRGVVANRRTIEMLEITELRALMDLAPLSIPQGSYNPGGVGASGGTHDGGGVLDVSVRNLTATQRQKVVLELRRTGFAAWYRTPAQGFVYHIHAVAIGDKELSSTARQQVVWYKQGYNGLWDGHDSNGNPLPDGPDDGPHVPITVYRQDIDMSYYGPENWDAEDLVRFRKLVATVPVGNSITTEPGDTISLENVLQYDRKRLYDTETLLKEVAEKVGVVPPA